MDRIILLLLMFVAGCTTYNDYRNPGMNEWDYKMYNEGWVQEYIGNTTFPMYIRDEEVE